MKYIKTILLLLIVSTGILLGGCQSQGAFTDKLGAAIDLQTDLPKATDQYKKSKKLYYDSKRHFSKDEQSAIGRSIETIDQVLLSIKDIQDAEGVNKAVQLAELHQEWSDGTKAYLTIKTIFFKKLDQFPKRQRDQLKRLHRTVVQLNKDMQTITPDKLGDFDTGNVAQLVAAVGLMISNVQAIKEEKKSNESEQSSKKSEKSSEDKQETILDIISP